MIMGYIDTSAKNILPAEQQTIIDKYAEENHLKIDVILNDSDIANLPNQVQTSGHTVIVANIVVLGSSLQKITDNLERLMSAKHSIVVVQGDMRFEPNVITPKVIEGIRLAIRIRSSLTSTTTLNVFREKVAGGGKLGRAFGCKNKNSIAKQHGDFILESIRKGMSKSAIARTLNISPRSVYNILKEQEQTNAE